MSDTTPDSTRTSGPAAGTGAGAPALVDVSWLAEHLGEPDLVVLDATMGPSPSSPRIPGARWFDHDEAMAAPGSDLPHTLPGIEHFQEQVRRLGVDDAGHVVVYDGTGIFSSPRARWMLRQAGHGRVSVLDGGLPAWLDAGLPTEPWPEEADPRQGPEPGDFTATGSFEPAVVPMAGLEALLTDPGFTVVDARAHERFTGQVPEPRPGLRAGHMPGAVNLPFTELLVDGRLMRSPDELRRILDAAIPPGTRPVASCGSGVTATVILFALELVGRGDGLLYDGSWSQWGRPDGGAVVTGEA